VALLELSVQASAVSFWNGECKLGLLLLLLPVPLLLRPADWPNSLHMSTAFAFIFIYQTTGVVNNIIFIFFLNASEIDMATSRVLVPNVLE